MALESTVTLDGVPNNTNVTTTNEPNITKVAGTVTPQGDTTNKYAGAASMKVVLSSAGTGFIEVTRASATTGNLFMDLKFRPSGVPGANCSIVIFKTSEAGSSVLFVTQNTDGTLKLQDNNGVRVGGRNTTTTMTSNAWNRIQVGIDGSGNITLKVWAAANIANITPDDTVTGTTANSSIGYWQVGPATSTTWTQVNFDSIITDTASWPLQDATPGPSTVHGTTSIAAPGVVTSTSSTVTGISTVLGSASIAAFTVQISIDVFPAEILLAASIPTPGLATPIVLGTVQAVTTIPQPKLSSLPRPATVQGIVTIPQPGIATVLKVNTVLAITSIGSPFIGTAPQGLAKRRVAGNMVSVVGKRRVGGAWVNITIKRRVGGTWINA